jgi:hypothetical protein
VLEDLASFYRDVLRIKWSTDIEVNGAKQDVFHIADAVTYHHADYQTISLWDRQPFKIILNDGVFTIWDIGAIPSYLKALASQVGFLDGDTANHKSVAFEDQVKALIARCDKLTAWNSGILRAYDDSKRELDASFIVGDTLYVVECKAFSANPRIDRGDFAALNGRWKTLKRYLEQARSLAEFLTVRREGRNYCVLATVRRIDYCVCTPLAEWIPGLGSDCWFDTETPRICTPHELVEFASGTKRRLFSGKSSR